MEAGVVPAHYVPAAGESEEAPVSGIGHVVQVREPEHVPGFVNEDIGRVPSVELRILEESRPVAQLVSVRVDPATGVVEEGRRALGARPFRGDDVDDLVAGEVDA